MKYEDLSDEQLAELEGYGDALVAAEEGKGEELEAEVEAANATESEFPFPSFARVDRVPDETAFRSPAAAAEAPEATDG